MDLLLFLVGKPLTMDARRFVRPDLDVDLMCHALMDLAGGGAIHFEANWHPLKKIGYQGRGWDESVEISGENGRLVLQTPVWDMPETAPAQLAYYDNNAETWTHFAFDAVNPFVLAEKHFLAQIRKGEQGSQDRYTGYRVDYLLETARQSAQQRRTIELKWEA
jgi:predicted dehydrogenase